jgi:hypothetical protein
MCLAAKRCTVFFPCNIEFVGQFLRHRQVTIRNVIYENETHSIRAVSFIFQYLFADGVEGIVKDVVLDRHSVDEWDVLADSPQ